MARYQIYPVNDGTQIAVVTPYHAEVVRICKAKRGRWITLKLKDRSVEAWRLDASHRPAIEALLPVLFPPFEALIERRIAFSAPNGSSASPTIDGYDLVSFTRDQHFFRRFERGESLQFLEIEVDDLDTSGSRNNPRLFGSCTVRVRCRVDAQAAWHHGTATILEEE